MQRRPGSPPTSNARANQSNGRANQSNGKGKTGTTNNNGISNGRHNSNSPKMATRGESVMSRTRSGAADSPQQNQAVPLGHENRIKVCIRVRPFTSRESGEKCIVDMPSKNNVVVLNEHASTQGGQAKFEYSYDRAYWSHDENEVPGAGYATQETLMDELGMELLQNAMNGYNDTLFAYGQTGSGKTWSVVGGKDMRTEAGLLPRMIYAAFEMMAAKQKDREENGLAPVHFQCRASYLEVYNDKLRDLLDPKAHHDGFHGNNHTSTNNGAAAVVGAAGGGSGLEVRQHPKLGIYVPGLTESACASSSDVMSLMDFGNTKYYFG